MLGCPSAADMQLYFAEQRRDRAHQCGLKARRLCGGGLAVPVWADRQVWWAGAEHPSVCAGRGNKLPVCLRASGRYQGGSNAAAFGFGMQIVMNCLWLGNVGSMMFLMLFV